ncbi:MAG: DEAD/DEAH box helicase [Akkermansia sp.]
MVATPAACGPLYRGTMRFGEVKALVLDEVDRMLDMGFLPIVNKIVNLARGKAGRPSSSPPPCPRSSPDLPNGA